MLTLPSASHALSGLPWWLQRRSACPVKVGDKTDFSQLLQTAAPTAFPVSEKPVYPFFPKPYRRLNLQCKASDSAEKFRI